MSLIHICTLRKFLPSSSSLRIKCRLNSTVESSKEVSIEPAPTKEKLVNRWLAFWKMLLNDYKIAIVESAKTMKDNPAKTLAWSSLIGFSVACCVTNPDEIDYRDNLRRRLNELIFVPKPIRNPDCMNYLETIEWLLNCNEMRRMNFGIFSIMMRTPSSEHLALYKDTCPYLQPSFMEIWNDYVFDFGFWNRWWMLERMMVDYDVNPEEWK